MWIAKLICVGDSDVCVLVRQEQYLSLLYCMHTEASKQTLLVINNTNIDEIVWFRVCYFSSTYLVLYFQDFTLFSV